MAQGLGALAQGFIQGSRLGMQIKQQEREADRQSELSKLRQSAEERAVSADARAQERHESDLTLREMQEQRLGKQEERATSAEERAVNREGRQQEELDWRVAKEERAEMDKKLSSIAPMEYKRVAQGGDFSPEFMDQAKGTRFDPVYMAKPEFGKAAKTAYEYVGDIVQKANAEGVENISLGDINEPKFLQSLSVLMQPDLKRGIGQKDPTTGKIVADKEIGMIVPYQGEGFVIDAKITLDDGSSYFAPITEGRSTDPDDPVKVIPVSKFMDSIEGYARMASAYNQPDLQNAVTRYSGTATKPNSSAEATKRQYLRELGDIDRDEAKELSKLDTDPLIAQEDKDSARKAISEKYQGLRKNTDSRYGVAPQKPIGKGSAAVNKPRGGGQSVIDVDTWSQGDPKKQAFIKSGDEYALESGESPFDAFTPDELEKLYIEWSNEQEADAVAQLLTQQ